MSLLDKIKAFFAGDTTAGSNAHDDAHDHAGHDHTGHDHAGHDHAGHDDDRGSSYLQSPTDPDEPIVMPTPEEIAAARQAEPPTTTVDALTTDDDSADEVR